MFSSHDADAQLLSSEALRAQFGVLSLDLLLQTDEGVRVSCLRRAEDGAPLACSVVRFDSSGVAALGVDHDRILQGAFLGETIAQSGVVHHRSVSVSTTLPTTYATRFLFDTQDVQLRSRIVEYEVAGMPYCRIRELYNPSFFSTCGYTSSQLETDVMPFVIARLSPSYGEAYLRLAHGFLQKDMHVGIKEEDVFVRETRDTLSHLLDDVNTHLFVAADDHQFIGYIALNIHPALHLNRFECVVRELYVRASARRHGVASALIAYAERFARGRRCKRLALATNWQDEAQRGFYESAGFARRCDFVAKPL